MDCHFLLQAIFLTQGLNLRLLCLLYCKRVLFLGSHWESGCCVSWSIDLSISCLSLLFCDSGRLGRLQLFYKQKAGYKEGASYLGWGGCLQGSAQFQSPLFFDASKETKDEMIGWHHLPNGCWVWASSGKWWRTGKPGVLQPMGLQSQTALSDWTRRGVYLQRNAKELPELIHFINSHLKIKVMQESYARVLSLGSLLMGMENSLGNNENQFITYGFTFSKILEG